MSPKIAAIFKLTGIFDCMPGLREQLISHTDLLRETGAVRTWKTR
jgi:hypothetical protein